MEIYNTQGGLSDKNIIDILYFIVEKIKDQDITRRLDGGVNLKIWGIARPPRDIDIRTNQAGYKSFKDIFLQTKKEEGYDEKKKKHYIIFNMQGSEVEIAYYDQEATCMDMFEDIIEKDRNNIKVPVLPLIKMKEFYTQIGSIEKTNLIENFLNKTNFQ